MLLHPPYQEPLIVDAGVVDVSVGVARDGNLESASEPVEVEAEAPLDIDNTVLIL